MSELLGQPTRLGLVKVSSASLMFAVVWWLFVVGDKVHAIGASAFATNPELVYDLPFLAALVWVPSLIGTLIFTCTKLYRSRRITFGALALANGIAGFLVALAFKVVSESSGDKTGLFQFLYMLAPALASFAILYAVTSRAPRFEASTIR